MLIFIIILSTISAILVFLLAFATRYKYLITRPYCINRSYEILKFRIKFGERDNTDIFKKLRNHLDKLREQEQVFITYHDTTEDLNRHVYPNETQKLNFATGVYEHFNIGTKYIASKNVLLEMPRIHLVKERNDYCNLWTYNVTLSDINQ